MLQHLLARLFAVNIGVYASNTARAFATASWPRHVLKKYSQYSSAAAYNYSPADDVCGLSADQQASPEHLSATFGSEQSWPQPTTQLIDSQANQSVNGTIIRKD